MEIINKTEEITLIQEFKKIFLPTKTTLIFILPLFILTIVYSIFYTENNFQLFSLIIIGFFISFSSIQDFNDKEVISFLLTPIAVSSIFFIQYNQKNDNFFTIVSYIFDNILIGLMIILFIYTLSLFLSVVLKKETMGSGDYPVFFTMGILLTNEIGIGLLLMSLSSILYKILTKEEFIPLIPFIYFSIISTLYIKEFLI
jgi:prepilin signal peptidase PulO-like enzyme (type II secretory pathway)